MPSVKQCEKNVVKISGQWAKARAVCRKLSDSKSAKKGQLEKAKKRYLAQTDKLELAIIELSKALQVQKPSKNTRTAFPWKEILGLASLVTGAAAKAVGQPQQVEPQVIDAEYEVVTPKD